MMIYAAGGFAGIPWLAGYNGGLSVLVGPTSGYVFGFILAALFIGHIIDSSPRSRKILPLLGLILFAQLVLVYVPGLIQLAAWLHLFRVLHSASPGYYGWAMFPLSQEYNQVACTRGSP
jgi:biotin transport system substrate-specific component